MKKALFHDIKIYFNYVKNEFLLLDPKVRNVKS